MRDKIALGLAGALCIGGCSYVGNEPVKTEPVENEVYYLPGHATLDLRKKPISTSRGLEGLANSLVELGSFDNIGDAKNFLAGTRVTYGDETGNPSVFIQSDTFPSYNEDGEIESVVHAETLSSFGEGKRKRKALFYLTDRPLAEIDRKYAASLVNSQRGFEAVPLDMSIPARPYNHEVSAEKFDEIWRSHDLSALAELREKYGPLNFLPKGSSLIVRTSYNGNEEYSAFEIFDRKDLGAFQEDSPFRPFYHEGWFMGIRFKRLD